MLMVRLCWFWQVLPSFRLMAQYWAAADKTHSPGLGLPPGYALFGPLGVRGQVVDQLAADLVGGLDGVVLLQTHTSDG